MFKSENTKNIRINNDGHNRYIKLSLYPSFGHPIKTGAYLSKLDIIQGLFFITELAALVQSFFLLPHNVEGEK